MPHAIANNSRHIRQEGVSMVFQRNSSGQTEEESLWRPNPETSWKRFRANHICWLHAHLLLVKFTRIKRKASTVSSRFWRKMVCSGCTLATAGYRPWWRCHFWRAPQKTQGLPSSNQIWPARKSINWHGKMGKSVAIWEFHCHVMGYVWLLVRQDRWNWSRELCWWLGA
jgi:hypothetical protein